MNNIMTFSTYRNNIKVMFWFITVPMMVLLCEFRATMALQSFRSRQFVVLNGIINGIAGFNSFRKFSSMFSTFTYCNFSSFFALIVMFKIYFFAIFAFALKSIFSGTIFVKLRNFFNFLAFGTSFCFNRFRHGFFLCKKLCLEPLQDQFLCGLFYINPFFNLCQE